MKYILVFVLMIGTFVRAGEPDVVLHEKEIYPAVAVWTPDGTSRGSGVIVSSREVDKVFINTVFTVNHILDGKSEVCVHVPIYRDWSTLLKYDTYWANVVRADGASDIAVLRFKSSRRLFTAEINWQPKLYLDNSVTMVGCGQSQTPRLSHGVVTSICERLSGHSKDVCRTSIFVFAGDSGAGVFHENKLVGVVKAQHMLRHGILELPAGKISYYVPVDRAFSTEDVK